MNVMGTRSYRKNLITTSFLTFVMIGGSISNKSLAKTNTIKGCDYSDNNNHLKSIPGYPSKNPEKTLFHELPYRASSGTFVIILKNGSICSIDMDASTEAKDKERVLKKFAEQYSGSKPIRICEVPASRDSMICKRFSK
jgi:hypothetical protein